MELIRTCDLTQPLEHLHDNEKLKARIRHLRGDIAEGLEEPITGAVSGDDTLLMKFHGIYQQDDRDKRAARVQRKLEPNYQFMVRMRIPGGRLTARQWLQLDDLSHRYAERGLRIDRRASELYLVLAQSYLQLAMPQQAEQFVQQGLRFAQSGSSVAESLMRVLDILTGGDF